MVVVVSVVEVEVEVVVKRKKSIAIASLADAVGRAHKVLDVQRGAERGGVDVVRGRRLTPSGSIRVQSAARVARSVRTARASAAASARTEAARRAAAAACGERRNPPTEFLSLAQLA